jgi:hypothetical protein
MLQYHRHPKECQLVRDCPQKSTREVLSIVFEDAGNRDSLFKQVKLKKNDNSPGHDVEVRTEPRASRQRHHRNPRFRRSKQGYRTFCGQSRMLLLWLIILQYNLESKELMIACVGSRHCHGRILERKLMKISPH